MLFIKASDSSWEIITNKTINSYNKLLKTRI